MNTRNILGCLLVAVAALLSFSQIYFLASMQPELAPPGFAHDYAIQSSIENFGFAIPAIVVGFLLLRGRARLWLWFALFIAGVGLWQFVIYELWLHFYELPHQYPHFAQVHPPYFTGPLWLVLVRLLWHIMLPAAFVLAVILLLSRAPNE